jgi:hypothetical protein
MLGKVAALKNLKKSLTFPKKFYTIPLEIPIYKPEKMEKIFQKKDGQKNKFVSILFTV